MTDIIEYAEWINLRNIRNQLLAATDWWALKDLTMSQSKKDYRQFLRDLPQDHETPQEAWAALDAYDAPE